MLIPKMRMTTDSKSSHAVMEIIKKQKLKARYTGDFLQINLPQNLTIHQTQQLVNEIETATWLEDEEDEWMNFTKRNWKPKN